MDREELISFIVDIIQFEDECLKDLPSGAHNSYGAGYSAGSKHTANRILRFIETGEDIDD